jgi:ABC-type multidrug transport system ATPase subunit
MLEGEVLPTAGRVEMGHEIYPGYCPQDHRDIIPRGTTPFEWLYSFAPAETIGTIRGILGRVLLRGDDVDKDTESLSGGESSRLIFSRVMLEKPNLLLLDEPTNHMDIESLEALGEALRKYEGTIVCVSHDRRFIEKFATAILELHENGFELFWGSYNDYLEKFGNDYLDRATAPLSANSFRDKKGTSKKRKEWKRASREVARLDRAIEKKETEISMVEVELSQQDEQLLDNRLYLPENKGELDAILVEKEKYERRLVSLTDDWESLQRTLDEITAETGDG